LLVPQVLLKVLVAQSAKVVKIRAPTLLPKPL
jgi:hypothetical protein